jgi:hypothetical protein
MTAEDTRFRLSGVNPGLIHFGRSHYHGSHEMTQENEHVKVLIAARDSLVTERRDTALTLSKPYRRGHSEETLDLFTRLQQAIQAVEEAIKHERVLADLREPPLGAGHV